MKQCVSCCPFCAEKLGLLQDKLCCFVLKVWRVAVLSQYALNEDLDFGAGAFA